MNLTLIHFWRSSSSWRVRWGLHLKGLTFESVQVDLLKEESESPEHLKRNPMGYVPVLSIKENGKVHQLSESMVILQWLNERFPEPSLFPKDEWLRFRSLQLAEIVNAGIQPLANYGVPEFWTEDTDQVKVWCQHWAKKGLGAAEALLRETAGTYSIGDTISLADLFLVPQCWGASRKGVDLSAYPTLNGIYERALKTEACKRAHPDSYAPTK